MWAGPKAARTPLLPSIHRPVAHHEQAQLRRHHSVHIGETARGTATVLTAVAATFGRRLRRGSANHHAPNATARVSWARRLSWLARPSPWPGPSALWEEIRRISDGRSDGRTNSACRPCRTTPAPSTAADPHAIRHCPSLLESPVRRHNICGDGAGEGRRTNDSRRATALPTAMTHSAAAADADDDDGGSAGGPNDPERWSDRRGRVGPRAGISDPTPPTIPAAAAAASSCPRHVPPIEAAHWRITAARAVPPSFRLQHAVIYCLLYLLLLVPKPCRGFDIASSDQQQQFRCPETCSYDTPEMPAFEEFCSRPQPRAEASPSTRTIRADAGAVGATRGATPMSAAKPAGLPAEQAAEVQFKEFKELTRKPPRLREGDGESGRGSGRDQGNQAGGHDAPGGPPIDSASGQRSLLTGAAAAAAASSRDKPGEVTRPAPPVSARLVDDDGDQRAATTAEKPETLADDPAPSKITARAAAAAAVVVDKERRESILDETAADGGRVPRLRICEHISPEMLLDRKTFCNASLEERARIWDRLWDEDRKACETVCQMEKLFDRFDCNLRYSVRWSCRHCQSLHQSDTDLRRLTHQNVAIGAAYSARSETRSETGRPDEFGRRFSCVMSVTSERLDASLLDARLSSLVTQRRHREPQQSLQFASASERPSPSPSERFIPMNIVGQRYESTGADALRVLLHRPPPTLVAILSSGRFAPVSRVFLFQPVRIEFTAGLLASTCYACLRADERPGRVVALDTPKQATGFR
ncbi:hypothetical protein BIW11_11011 [Tropilaelaps mercedesae]|uniref:Uncharacterized protein n=1 Tax=Tropilaelaps mercedesae TaxID=418985 RepID=A0A1V9XDE3_9ACAR|nr:hypothetical protein BIW11_11011 [Tropilaelaps mercedesae]